jgi:hypothetical protein
MIIGRLWIRLAPGPLGYGRFISTGHGSYKRLVWCFYWRKHGPF